MCRSWRRFMADTAEGDSNGSYFLRPPGPRCCWSRDIRFTSSRFRRAQFLLSVSARPVRVSEAQTFERVDRNGRRKCRTIRSCAVYGVAGTAHAGTTRLRRASVSRGASAGRYGSLRHLASPAEPQLTAQARPGSTVEGNCCGRARRSRAVEHPGAQDGAVEVKDERTFDGSSPGANRCARLNHVLVVRLRLTGSQHGIDGAEKRSGGILDRCAAEEDAIGRTSPWHVLVHDSRWSRKHRYGVHGGGGQGTHMMGIGGRPGWVHYWCRTVTACIGWIGRVTAVRRIIRTRSVRAICRTFRLTRGWSRRPWCSTRRSGRGRAG